MSGLSGRRRGMSSSQAEGSKRMCCSHALPVSMQACVQEQADGAITFLHRSLDHDPDGVRGVCQCSSGIPQRRADGRVHDARHCRGGSPLWSLPSLRRYGQVLPGVCLVLLWLSSARRHVYHSLHALYPSQREKGETVEKPMESMAEVTLLA